MSATTRDVPGNEVLGALPRQDYERLLSGLEPVTLTFGEILYEPGNRIRYVYFPVDSLVSLLTLVEGRLALEVGMVGHEGMVGTPITLGVMLPSVRALVQGTGSAMRMSAARFRLEFRKSGALQRVLHHYVHVLMAQVSQTAACNRFHQVEARLARWLLMTRDRVRSDQFHLTQEFLSHMLGVRRVGVTKAASALQRKTHTLQPGPDQDSGWRGARIRCVHVLPHRAEHVRQRPDSRPGKSTRAAPLQFTIVLSGVGPGIAPGAAPPLNSH